MAIEFRKTSSADPVVAYITLEISEHLAAGEDVLWIVTGGSSIKTAASVADKLRSADLKKLTAVLSDERYGPPGHSDSNWSQLIGSGFKLPGAKLIPILDGSSMKDTVERFDKILRREIKNADYKIGLIGVGPDSHIAGIKPGSPAMKTTAMAIGYDWDDHRRITMTFAAISLMDAVVAYMGGEAKRSAIETLEADAPLRQAPSQILKQVAKAVIFNDRVGKEIT